MTMQKTIKVDKQHVEKRVDDWKKRVSVLFSTIELWLMESDFYIKRGSKLKMYEELMSEFKIRATDIETADIYKDNKIVLTIKPKGLWIVGANGRIDLLSTKGNYTLVDFAEQFEPPQWKLFNSDKKNGVTFTKQLFFQLLAK
ncbi:MAG: hypothetical protein Q8N83_02865 [Ignavibacteria bacterium]|nr:hypothetical protein [Ignavibacteria bacterium]